MVLHKLDEKARKIKLLLLDVDGVLTDGSIIIDHAGEEIKVFNVRDGVAIKWLQRMGVEVAILSGRHSPALSARAKELGIERVITGKIDKLPSFEKLLEETGLKPEQIAFMGDDLYDLPVLKRAGISACPSDAVKEVKNICDYICAAQGGRGAVREVAELLLKSQDKWRDLLTKYNI
jgi:3-deoxy-D-manno-octulosonate 8-phosphate phosphatase (KDO 8-P phosphatase)